jgi:nicotinamidase-related amidase
VQKLIEGLKILQIPLLITQQYSKVLGTTINTIFQLVPDLKPIEKLSFSCCDEPLFNEALAKQGKTNVIICGIEAHVCIEQTALDLIEKGYQPVLIENCISSRKEEDIDTAVKRMRMEGVIITSYEAILFELCRFSGTDQFKALSKILK